MRNSFIAAVFFGLCLLFSSFNSFADENSAPAPIINSVDGKLDKIMNTQAEILKQLDEMKEELQIVKIRASQR